jgi:hypothetical protein
MHSFVINMLSVTLLMKYMKVMYDDERVKMLMEGEWYEGIDF